MRPLTAADLENTTTNYVYLLRLLRERRPPRLGLQIQIRRLAQRTDPIPSSRSIVIIRRAMPI